MSNVEIVITPNVKNLGDNFLVRRSLPISRKRSVGPFIFWDHMGPVSLIDEREMTVRSHPHIGLATITWLFSGEIMHRDSLGNEQMIRPGEVNWMTAGKGIVHSERSSSKDSEMTLEGIQLWLALPREYEDVEPSFFHCKETDIPSIEEQGLSLKLIAGKSHGVESPVPVYSDLFYLNGESEMDTSFHLPLKANHEGAIYIVEGEIEVEGVSYKRFSLITFKKGTSVDFKTKGKAKFMIFGGEVFPEKRYMWWNFVSTSKEKIEEAKRKWTAGEFPEVINEVESIPLPQGPLG